MVQNCPFTPICILSFYPWKLLGDWGDSVMGVTLRKNCINPPLLTVLIPLWRIQQQNIKLSSTSFFVVVRNSLVSMVTDACLSSCHVSIVTDITILYRTMSLTYLLYHPEIEAEKTSLAPGDLFLFFTGSILCKTWCHICTIFISRLG